MTQGKSMEASTGGSTLSPASPPATRCAPPKGMKLVVGSPGTRSGMALRVSQCVLAAASVCAMVTTFGFSANNHFRFMNTVMLLQFLWSLGLACLDIYAIRKRKNLHNQALVSVLVAVDWIMGELTLGAAIVSCCMASLSMDDVDSCRRLLKEACGQPLLSVTMLPIGLTFIGSYFAAISGSSMSKIMDTLSK